MFFASSLILALIGGILPPLLWLWFWRKEDKKRPEPRGMIVLTFLAGMGVVPLAIPFQRWSQLTFGENMALILFAWAAIEELLKFAAAYLVAFRSRYLDEPIDAVIYLITAALGFAALENAFFLLGTLTEGNYFDSFVTGNLRFIGATVLHTVSSGIIGATFGLAYYRAKSVRRAVTFFGLSVAIVLHALFNSFIMEYEGVRIFYVFGGIWIMVVGLLILFERVKKVSVRDKPSSARAR